MLYDVDIEASACVLSSRYAISFWHLMLLLLLCLLLCLLFNQHIPLRVTPGYVRLRRKFFPKIKIWGLLQYKLSSHALPINSKKALKRYT